ncbi:hypothetical protein, partial [Acinetobacter sp.]|uniref:hypothetical protein n=1 Tax=Acinetobacter sp. TaxID=472 RepID=UPI002FC8B033
MRISLILFPISARMPGAGAAAGKRRETGRGENAPAGNLYLFSMAQTQKNRINVRFLRLDQVGALREIRTPDPLVR